MKTLKLIFFAALVNNVSTCFGQISLDHIYGSSDNVNVVKLSLSGVKYCSMHYISGPICDSFILYNNDHSIFKAINIPPVPNKRSYAPVFISETLFDLDSLVEYGVAYQDSTTGYSEFRIINEQGNVLLAVDSAILSSSSNFYPIFYDGIQTKMILLKNYGSGVWNNMVYNLPGYLTCVDCNNGIVDAIAPPHENAADGNQSLAYPNPATEFIKIKYELPAGYRHAVVNLLDITGKLIKQKQIGEHFNEIYISTEEINQGAYIYQVVIDNKVTTSGKVIKL